MSGKYLLDTNIVIALFAEDPSVQKLIARAGEIFIPAVVIGELFLVLSSLGGQSQIPRALKTLLPSIPSLRATSVQAESTDASRSSCIKRGCLFRKTILGLLLWQGNMA